MSGLNHDKSDTKEYKHDSYCLEIVKQSLEYIIKKYSYNSCRDG